MPTKTPAFSAFSSRVSVFMSHFLLFVGHPADFFGLCKNGDLQNPVEIEKTPPPIVRKV